MHLHPRLLSLFLLSSVFCTSLPLEYVVAREEGRSSATHERFLALEGGRNFRDLGGYRTSDGRTVKWHLLFRSGSMDGLTPADFGYLAKLGIRVVCDFRDVRERAAAPVPWPSSYRPRVFSDDYDMGLGMAPPKEMVTWSSEEARRFVRSTYAKMPVSFKGQFRTVFTELLTGHAPLAFNCTAGKDRTGVAAALLLTALGVPRETVIQDYLLTNLAPRRTTNGASAGWATVGNEWAKLPPAVSEALKRADRSYIESALHTVDRFPGGPRGYFASQLGLTNADLEKLREMYLDQVSTMRR